MRAGISTAFLQRAAEVLSDALSGAQIVAVTTAFAVDFDVEIPHAAYPFNAGNKKSALFENLRPFSPSQQYQIIHELCDRVATSPNATFEQKSGASQLKITLLSRYYEFSTDSSPGTTLPLVVTEAKHWLGDYPSARKTYEEALQKLANAIFHRNALDDLRLSLELLLKQLLGNDKPLEKQVSEIGRLIKQRGGSAELANMLEKLVEYYAKYQNAYVKHDDAIPQLEGEFVLELSACFMKHLIRIKAYGES